jgi:hypothetical protein
MEKNFLFFELLECMKDDGCAVCRLVNLHVDRYISSLLYEQLDDLRVRKSIYHSKGFCYEHSRKILEKGDPLAHAIIYSRLFEEEAKRLDVCSGTVSTSKSVSLLRRLFHRFKKGDASFRNECPACRIVKECETQVLSLIPYFYKHDPAFRVSFQETGNLCVPHVNMLLSLNHNDTTIEELITLQSEKYKVLANHLREIERKHDYRFCEETQDEEEKKAWRVAVEYWIGQK